MRVSLFVLLIIPVSLSISAAEAWDLAVMGGLNYSQPSLNPDPPVGTTLSTKSAFDIGALGAFPISDGYQLEGGLIRHTRITALDNATSSTESRYSGWLIPLRLRFMRAEFLGFGFGPYIGLLNARTKTITRYASGSSGESDADDPNRKSLEFGLNINLRIAIPVYHEAKLVLDGSYLFGVTDINKSGTAEDKTQDLLLLVGFQIPIGVDSEPATSTEQPETLKTKGKVK
jgi:hypothetical protein